MVTVYIVELEESYLPIGSQMGKPAAEFKRGFSTQEAARKWIPLNPPIDLDPFAECWQSDEDEGGDLLIVYTNASSQLVSLRELDRIVSTMGLIPPTYTDSMEMEWQYWWKKNAPHLTAEQKTTLWEFIAPKPWRITEVEAEL